MSAFYVPVAGPSSFAPAGGFSNDVQRGLRVKSIVMLLIGTAAFAVILPSCTRANSTPSFQLQDDRDRLGRYKSKSAATFFFSGIPIATETIVLQTIARYRR